MISFRGLVALLLTTVGALAHGQDNQYLVCGHAEVSTTDIVFFVCLSNSMSVPSQVDSVFTITVSNQVLSEEEQQETAATPLPSIPTSGSGFESDESCVAFFSSCPPVGMRKTGDKCLIYKPVGKQGKISWIQKREVPLSQIDGSKYVWRRYCKLDSDQMKFTRQPLFDLIDDQWVSSLLIDLEKEDLGKLIFSEDECHAVFQRRYRVKGSQEQTFRGVSFDPDTQVIYLNKLDNSKFPIRIRNAKTAKGETFIHQPEAIVSLGGSSFLIANRWEGPADNRRKRFTLQKLRETSEPITIRGIDSFENRVFAGEESFLLLSLATPPESHSMSRQGKEFIWSSRYTALWVTAEHTIEFQFNTSDFFDHRGAEMIPRTSGIIHKTYNADFNRNGKMFK